MKKFIFLLLLFISNLYCLEVGIGYTADTGAHIRISKFEIQSLFDKDFTSVGLRFYPLTKNLKIINQNFDLYLGIESNYVTSDLLDWGHASGVFSGFQKQLFKGLHLSADIGVFVCTLKGFEEFTEWGMALNTKLTWLFKIGK